MSQNVVTTVFTPVGVSCNCAMQTLLWVIAAKMNNRRKSMRITFYNLLEGSLL